MGQRRCLELLVRLPTPALLAVDDIAARTSRSQSRSHANLFCVFLHGFSRKRETARRSIFQTPRISSIIRPSMFIVILQVRRDCGGEFEKNRIPMPECSMIYPEDDDPKNKGLCHVTAFPVAWPVKRVEGMHVS